MTLLRQLLIAILVLLTVVLAGSLAVSVGHTRSYLDAQLRSHAQDAATSLGLSLSSSAAEGDQATLEAMVDAVFDSGYYRIVSVVDNEGRTLAQREQQDRFDDVPAWFVRLLPLHPPRGEALLMSGWRRLGQVEVTSNPGYAYLELWRTTRDSARLFALVAAVAAGLAGLGVHVLLRPLRATEAQAAAIADRQFPVQDRLPRTRELRRVVEAMNHMSRKVRQMLDEQIALGERLREQAYRDPVTGLGNRALFDRDLEHLLASREAHFQGVLVLVQLRHLRHYNATHGYAAGDELLRQAASALRNAADEWRPHCLARLTGADFGLLIAADTDDDLAALGTALGEALARLHERGLTPDADVGHIGMARRAQNDTPATWLSRADAALRAAQTTAGNAWQLAREDDSRPSRSATAWRALIGDAVANNRIELYSQPVQQPHNQATVVHHEVLLRISTDEGLLPAGGFMPMAERLGLAPTVDRAVISAVLARLQQASVPGRLAVNLSPGSLSDPQFIDWLLAQLDQHRQVTGRVTFELPEYGASSDTQALRALAGGLAARGCGLGLDHFGRGFNPLGYLAGLKLAYLKVDGRYIQALAGDADSRQFIRTLREVAHGLDCLIIAEGVENAAQLAAVTELRLDGAQGYHLAAPQPL
jgi:diguanylate cyclase (GGDEF)-like protein